MFEKSQSNSNGEIERAIPLVSKFWSLLVAVPLTNRLIIFKKKKKKKNTNRKKERKKERSLCFLYLMKHVKKRYFNLDTIYIYIYIYMVYFLCL